MAKDPAFLFYSSDFITGTLFMSNEQVGSYIRLLCMQHQKGHLTEKDMLHICKSYDEDVFSKFIKDSEGKYYNERCENEINKRKSYSESRANNRKGIDNKQVKPLKDKKDMNNISKTYDKHMENEIVNEDVIVNVNKDINVSENSKIEINPISKEILLFLNETANKFFHVDNKNFLSKINARLKEGYTEDELKEIIQMKTMEWINDDKMKKYLTPDTLFNAEKCAKYREQLKQAKLNPQQFKNSINGKSNYPNTSYFDGTTPYDNM